MRIWNAHECKRRLRWQKDGIWDCGYFPDNSFLDSPTIALNTIVRWINTENDPRMLVYGRRALPTPQSYPLSQFFSLERYRMTYRDVLGNKYRILLLLMTISLRWSALEDLDDSECGVEVICVLSLLINDTAFHPNKLFWESLFAVMLGNKNPQR